MEMIDVLDAAGNPTGEQKSKDNVHRDGDWHRSAHIWLLTPSQELLLQRRAKDKVNYPDMLDISAAGHVSAGESVTGSAVREIEEELGISAQEDDLTYLFTVTQEVELNRGAFIEREHQDVFLIERDIDVERLTFADGEVQHAQFVTVDAFAAMVADKQSELVPHPEEYQKLLQYLRSQHA